MNQTHAGSIERKALIFNVQKYNMYDGPGIRTIVFFKGCPLRCKWCSNPEGMDRSFQVMFKKRSCVDCGACVNACPAGIHVLPRRPENTKSAETETAPDAENAWRCAPRKR